MAKLSTYTNNLFVTHATLEEALEYAFTVANACETPSAVTTSIQAVLNTAIAMHLAELAAANKPLRDMIEQEIQKSFTVVQNSIEQALDAYTQKVDDRIEMAIEDIDFDDKMQGWYDSNFDIESALSGTSISITFD